MAERDTSRLLKDVIDSVPSLAPNGTNQHSERNRGFDIIKPSYKGGTSSGYLAARIKRDAPEIAVRIGDFGSIRAAAKEAGIVRELARSPFDFFMACYEMDYEIDRMPPQDEDDGLPNIHWRLRAILGSMIGGSVVWAAVISVIRMTIP